MSSLLQFNGRSEGGRVPLQAYKVAPRDQEEHERYARSSYEDLKRACPNTTWTWEEFLLDYTTFCDASEEVPCTIEGCKSGKHPLLYEFPRKPVGMLGCWVQFRWQGHTHAPDLSIPLKFQKLPGDAKPMTVEASSEAWHK